MAKKRIISFLVGVGIVGQFIPLFPGIIFLLLAGYLANKWK